MIVERIKFVTTKSMRQGGIEPPAQLISTYMAKLYFTTKPLALTRIEATGGSHSCTTRIW